MNTLPDFQAVYHLPLQELIFRAGDVQRANRGVGDVQRCALLSIKTGGCPEDCGYCSQSAHYDTPVAREPLMSVGEVKLRAREARDRGATRFCMGAAWRGPKDGPEFDAVLDMVREVRALNMEACVTLGMLSADQARRLKVAGENITSAHGYVNAERSGSFDRPRVFYRGLARLAASGPDPVGGVRAVRR